MRKFFNFIKKVVFWSFFVSLTIVTLATILLKIYEDDIEQYAISEINQYLNTKVEIQDVDVTILRNFPYASLNFQKVLIHDAYENIESPDTLLFTENLYLSFNIWDIWNENYTVKNVSANDGVLKIKTADNGDVNYLITKPEIDTIDTNSNFKFRLDWLTVENLRFEYANMITKQFYLLNLKEADFEGDFSETNYQLKARSDLQITKLKTNSFSLIKNKSAKLDLALNINTEKKEYTFEKGDLKIEKMPFHITGVIDSNTIDLRLKGDNIELDELSKTILNNSVEASNNYEGFGTVNFLASIQGPLSNAQMPSIIADFSVKNGKVKQLETNLSLTEINLVGHYQNKQNNRLELLEIENVSLVLLDSKFKGNTKISDFKVPTFKGKLEGNIDLASFHKFFKFKAVELIEGIVDFSTSYQIQFPDIEYNPHQFDLENTKGSLTIKNGLFKGVDNELSYKAINGDVLIIDNDAATKNLAFKTSKSDFLINGAVKNLIPYIEGNGDLGLVASIESAKIDVNEFLTNPHTLTAEELATKDIFELPGFINLNLELNIGELLWQNHKFTKIDGKLLMSDHTIKINQFSLQTLGGAISGNFELQNLLNKGNVIESLLKFKDIDVKKLFAEWDNFDQVTITDKNLSGQLSGDIDLLLLFDEYFEIIEDKIYVKSNIKIQNGALTEMETMKDITAYMRSNKALKMALNKHIDQFEEKIINLKFSELTNTIEIKDRKIVIPKMLIQTNALDVEFSGWHDFDNNIEYHFSFRFRDLKTTPEYTEFGKVEDDGLGWKIYLTMKGNIENPEYVLDKGEMKANFKENVENEKSSVKSILKTEFNLFNKDTTVTKVKTANDSEAVEFIYYEEEDSLSLLNPQKSKNKTRTNKFFEKMKEKADKQKKEEETESQSEFY